MPEQGGRGGLGTVPGTRPATKGGASTETPVLGTNQHEWGNHKGEGLEPPNMQMGRGAERGTVPQMPYEADGPEQAGALNLSGSPFEEW